MTRQLMVFAGPDSFYVMGSKTIMDLITFFKEEAKKHQKRLVLPEGGDPRTIQAARRLLDERIAAAVTVVGRPDNIMALAKDHNIDVSSMELVDPDKDDRADSFAQTFYDLRKHKGISEDDAAQAIRQELNFGAMLLKTGAVDGMVAGAANATADVIRAGLYIIKTKPGNSTISSCFVMTVPGCELGSNGSFIFADCGVVIDPSPRQLANIAESAADSCRKLLRQDPVVAFLSFSTKGSAQHESIDKITQAMTHLAKSKPDFPFDGELQLDAAIIDKVAGKKAPDSQVAGKANVLIFPDLQSGNIGYKLTERLAGATALGPLLQGLAKPINDLSRGCSIDDIVNVGAITILQSL